jgi:uncharacterized protein YcnI
MRRILGILGATVAIVAVATAGTAAAHVTIQPGEATQGGFATLFVQVPNEKAEAGTVKVEVTMPVDHPIANVSFEPVPGWTITPERSTLSEPITVHGEEITEAVTKITFEGGPVAPGQFVRFPLSMGPMPEGVDQLTFPAVQTYSDGDVVRWIETGADAERPAPTVTLVAGSGDDHGDDAGSSDDEAAADGSHDESSSDDTLAIVAIVVGGVGVLLALVALLRKGRTAA